MNTATQRAIDPDRMHAHAIKMVTELGAAAMGSLVLIGDELGLYRALADGEALTSHQLAERCGVLERYAREWLAANAASGYVDYDAATETFSMSPEQAAVLGDENSPLYMGGGFASVRALWSDEPRLREVFRGRETLGWGDHQNCLFSGVAKFFKPSYQAHLVQDWIPAIDGAHERLERGAKVADVGCGHGHSTILMAQRYPNSTFVGYDIHAPSIETARRHANEAGATNVRFETAAAKEVPNEGWDLVTTFDCLHDMGDPRGAAEHVKSILADDGRWMIVEPMAQDDLTGNLNPVGRVYYAFSTTVCTPTSLSQEVGAALGAQAGEKTLSELLRSAGFAGVRRAAETPFNMVLEARA